MIEKTLSDQDPYSVAWFCHHEFQAKMYDCFHGNKDRNRVFTLFKKLFLQKAGKISEA